jgi:Domain of Unknown Function with PDB structure (DUF3862)
LVHVNELTGKAFNLDWVGVSNMVSSAKTLLTWIWILTAALFIAVSATERYWIAAGLFLISLLAALPPFWKRLPIKDPSSSQRAVACVGAAFAGLLAVGIAGMNTPEAKAARTVAETAAKAAAAKEEALLAESKLTEQRADELKAEAVRKSSKARVNRNEAAIAEHKIRRQENNRVSMVNYHRIANGMTFDEVVEIIGQPDQERARNQFEGFETVVFEWVGEGWLPGSMVLTFQNGRLFQKEQSNLE